LNLEFLPNEHVGCVGATQSGKTTFSKRVLLGSWNRIFIVDTKGVDFRIYPTVSWKRAVEQVAEADRSNGDHSTAKFRWRLPFGVGKKAEQDVDAFSKAVLAKTPNVTVYFDELGAYTTSYRISHGLSALATQGAGKGRRLYWSSQRPARVHGDIWDNTVNLFVFAQHPKDRQAIRRNFPAYDEFAGQIPFGSYKFAYQNPAGEVSIGGPV
jgi:hypothetical protein